MNEATPSVLLNAFMACRGAALFFKGVASQFETNYLEI